MLSAERNNWPKKRWIACVGGNGSTWRTLTEAKQWVERTIAKRDGIGFLSNSVIVQTGTGSTYQGRTVIGYSKRRTSINVAWTKLPS
jgi:hypothetical protein